LSGKRKKRIQIFRQVFVPGWFAADAKQFFDPSSFYRRFIIEFVSIRIAEKTTTKNNGQNVFPTCTFRRVPGNRR
jgi:hypothetical protein